MQTQLSKGKLLNESGDLIEAGYATTHNKSYLRKDIKVKGLRIKEWDYYYIGNDTYGFAVTVADNDYMSLVSVTWFDFIKKEEMTKSKMKFLTRGKLGMPSSPHDGNVIYKDKGFEIYYLLNGKQREIMVEIASFKDEKPLSAHLYLDPTIDDSLVIAIPFHKKGHFYYNHKMNLLKASGHVEFMNQTFDFSNAYGVLDWGRGVWTYKNTWYWSSLSGEYEGKKIGFNLGYGFGDTSKATENILYIDDQTYKFDDVTFHIPKQNGRDDFMSPWTIASESKNIHLTFEPILDRHANTNIGIIQSNQHQVFGKFSGEFILPDQSKITIKDMMGFAEKVYNRW